MITRVYSFFRGPAYQRSVPREAEIAEYLKGGYGELPVPKRLSPELDAYVNQTLALGWDQAVEHVDKNLDLTFTALKELAHDDPALGLELEKIKEEIEAADIPAFQEINKHFRTENDFDPRKGDIDWQKVRSMVPPHFSGWIDSLEQSTNRTLSELPNVPFELGFDWTRWYREQWERWRGFSQEMTEVSRELDRAYQELEDFERDLPYISLDDLKELYPDLIAEAVKKIEAREWMVDEDNFYFNDRLADEELASRQEALEAWAKQFREEEDKYVEDLVSGREPKPLTKWSFVDLINITGTNPIDKTPRVVQQDHHHH